MGSVLYVVGSLVGLVGSVMFLIIAFKKSALWGLGCLFVPFVGLAFLIMNWNDTKKAFLIQIIGAVIVMIAASLLVSEVIPVQEIVK